MASNHNKLTHLFTLAEYQAARANVFPSQASLDWFIRRYRSRIISAGALLMPTGRKLIDGDRFDDVVIDVGHAAAGEPT